jgi:predicted enzyme related to lactoylglutathione lyase
LPARHILTILAVTDLERSVDFYTSAFGWPVRVTVPAYVEFELPDGNGLGLYRREAFAGNTGQEPHAVPAGATTGTEIYLRCADLEAGARRVEEAGGRILSPAAPRDWGDVATYFADPDGNVLVLAVPANGSE